MLSTHRDVVVHNLGPAELGRATWIRFSCSAAVDDAIDHGYVPTGLHERRLGVKAICLVTVETPTRAWGLACDTIWRRTESSSLEHRVNISASIEYLRIEQIIARSILLYSHGILLVL
jgi:hypothetical protein